MYRQIWVAANHCGYQRIVWREDETIPIKHYELSTVTYGTSCAPFLAVRVLDQLAHWVSNSSRVADRSLASTEVQGKGSNSTAKILGIHWDPEEDSYPTKFALQQIRTTTNARWVFCRQW